MVGLLTNLNFILTNIVHTNITVRGRQGRHFRVEQLIKFQKVEVGTFKNDYFKLAINN